MKIKIVIFTLVLLMLASSLSSLVMASNVQTFDMKNLISDSEGWSTLNKGNTNFIDGVLINESKLDDAREPIIELFGYTKEKHTDIIYDFDAVFDFKTVDKWQGFLIRSTEPLNVPWSNNSNYLIVVTGNQIELQRFGYKHAFLAVSPTPFKSGERVNIRYGAVNEEKGVHLFFSVNGKTIFDVYDTSQFLIREGGYFGVFNSGSVLKIYPSSRVGEKDSPAVNSTSISTGGKVGDSINIDYIYSDLYGTTEGETEYAWYRTLANIDHYGTSMALTDDLREKYLEKIEGATGKTYTITNSDVGFNIKCGITPKSEETGLLGEEFITNSVYIDTVSNMLGNGLFFVKDSCFAVLNGEKFKLNENEIPFMKYGKLFVPAEFSAKVYGYNVSYNGENIILEKEGRDVIISGSSALKNASGTSFFALDKLSQISEVAATYEAVFGIGMVNDLCAHLNPVQYAEILRGIRTSIVEQ